LPGTYAGVKPSLRGLTWPAVLAIVSGCSGAAIPPNGVTSQATQAGERSTAEPLARRCDHWKVVPGANPSSTNGSLYGVGGDAPNDVWAVGAYQSSSSFRTFAERWDGSAWSDVQTPNAGTGDNGLVAVAALSSSDAWAVGYSNPTSTAQTRTLIEHWDGTAWKVVSSESPGQLSALGGLAAESPNDVWAVGAYFNEAGNQQTLVERWNGKVWKVVSSPSPGSAYNGLSKLAVVTPKDIWAVGSSGNGNTSQTLVERWDGKIWQVIPSPNVTNAIYNSLAAIVAINANDLWAVGSSESYDGYETSTLVERWLGSSWQIVASPDVGTHGSSLADVSALSANDLWSVGSYIDPSDFLSRTLIEHWNGKAWRVDKSPSPGSVEDQLHAVTRVGATLWSVGNQNSTSANEPLTARLGCQQLGISWRVTAPEWTSPRTRFHGRR
jgi:hypothetical protein